MDGSIRAQRGRAQSAFFCRVYVITFKLEGGAVSAVLCDCGNANFLCFFLWHKYLNSFCIKGFSLLFGKIQIENNSRVDCKDIKLPFFLSQMAQRRHGFQAEKGKNDENKKLTSLGQIVTDVLSKNLSSIASTLNLVTELALDISSDWLPLRG